MKVLMFRNQWVEPIRAGTKVQTMRAKRVYPVKVGDELSLRHWLGVPRRSKQEIIMARRCTGVHAVKLTPDYLLVDSMPVSAKGIAKFAARDGFVTFADMVQFFEEMHGLPFKGDVISWD